MEERHATGAGAWVGVLAVSRHGALRCARRGIPADAVRSAWQYGRLIRRAGARFLYLGRREVEEACAGGADHRALERWQGLVVLLAEDGRVITVYKNPRALADIRRKQAYDARETRRWA